MSFIRCSDTTGTHSPKFTQTSKANEINTHRQLPWDRSWCASAKTLPCSPHSKCILQQTGSDPPGMHRLACNCRTRSRLRGRSYWCLVRISVRMRTLWRRIPLCGASHGVIYGKRIDNK